MPCADRVINFSVPWSRYQLFSTLYKTCYKSIFVSTTVKENWEGQEEMLSEKNGDEWKNISFLLIFFSSRFFISWGFMDLVLLGNSLVGSVALNMSCADLDINRNAFWNKLGLFSALHVPCANLLSILVPSQADWISFLLCSCLLKTSF